MEKRPSPLAAILQKESETSFFLNVYIQPKASLNRISGVHAGALKISITAPPVDGKANKAVIGFVAKLLNIPKSSVTIRSGQQSRTKRLYIAGASAAAAEAILAKSVELSRPSSQT